MSLVVDGREMRGEFRLMVLGLDGVVFVFVLNGLLRGGLSVIVIVDVSAGLALGPRLEALSNALALSNCMRRGR